MQTWAYDERQALADIVPIAVPRFYEDGIYLPDYVFIGLGKWERQSLPLQVSSEYEKLIEEFSNYYTSEANSIQDPELDQEIKIMQKLLELSPLLLDQQLIHHK